MYNIGDKVIYSGMGVAEIVDIRSEVFDGGMRSYYVLKEMGCPTPSETLVPTDNKALVGRMRSLLSPEELVSIIMEAKSLPEIEWIKDNRARAENFKRMIQCGNRLELIRMINSIYEAGKRRTEEGKKNYISDESAMKKAENLLYSEISVVMGIEYDSVPEFIKNL